MNYCSILKLCRRKTAVVFIVVCIMLLVCIYYIRNERHLPRNIRLDRLKNVNKETKDTYARSASLAETSREMVKEISATSALLPDTNQVMQKDIAVRWAPFPNTSRVMQKYLNPDYNISKELFVNGKPTGNVSDPQVFSYIHNEPDACAGNVKLLVYIHSSVVNREVRAAIRSTWANPRMKNNMKMVVMFFLGVSKHSRDMAKVRTESLTHHDIIQEDYIDSYRNLSLKVGSTLKWITSYCSLATMVLKLDDDVLINMFVIQRFITKALHSPTKYIHSEKFMICMVLTSPNPDRHPESKWFISKEDYPQSKYPTYCPGNIMFISPAAVTALYDAILRTKFFWVDDVYISGMLREQGGVELVPIKRIDPKARVEFIPRMSDRLIREVVFIAFNYKKLGNISAMARIWKRLTLLFRK